jgi:hypothetical protein
MKHDSGKALMIALLIASLTSQPNQANMKLFLIVESYTIQLDQMPVDLMN